MANIKTRLGLLVAVAAAFGGVVAFGAAQASASTAPIVIGYQKTCVALHCEGTTAAGVTIVMDITDFRASGKAAQLTLTEKITLSDGTWFEAEMSGHFSPAGFIVLNGTVTDGAFVGAQVHQRSNFAGGTPAATDWIGELQLTPASA